MATTKLQDRTNSCAIDRHPLDTVSLPNSVIRGVTGCRSRKKFLFSHLSPRARQPSAGHRHMRGSKSCNVPSRPATWLLPSIFLPSSSYLINPYNSMTTSRPSTPVITECDSAATLSTQCNPIAGTSAASTWPQTQLILETPERKRLRYALQNGGIYTTPPKRAVIASPKTPVTPKRRLRNTPGENIYDECPSPLRRFRISRSATPLVEKYVNAISGTEYRFKGGETLSITPSKEEKDNNDSRKSPISAYTTHQSDERGNSLLPEAVTLDDSGISLGNDSTLDSSVWCSSTFDESAYFSNDMFNEASDSFQFLNDSENSLDSDSWYPPGDEPQENEVTDKAPVTATPVYETNNDDVEQLYEIEEQQSCEPISEAVNTVLDEPQKSSASSDTTFAPPSSKTKLNQKDLTEEINVLLDQFDDAPFNEEYVEDVDMVEFRKLKLMTSTTSNWYKTVLGRSRDQIEVTRDAHRHLNQVNRVKAKK